MASKGGKPPGGPPGDVTKPGDRVAHKHGKPDKALHRHDQFEMEIDTSDLDSTEVGHETFPDDEPTREVTLADLEDGGAIPLELPHSSEEESLPLFAPPVTSPKMKTLPPRTPTPRPKPRPAPPVTPSDVLSLLEDEVEPDSSASKPLAPVSRTPSRRPTTPDPGLPMLPPTPEPSSERKKPRFASGVTAGMAPLKIEEFEHTPPPTRKKSGGKVLLRSGPAPMAHSSRMVRRWIPSFTMRDLLLLALVVLLGIGLYLGWVIYQDIRRDNELKQLQTTQEQMEKEKQEVISDKKPTKEKDIP